MDTIGSAGVYLPLLKKDALLLSIARIPPGSALKAGDEGLVACVGLSFLDAQDAAFRKYAKMRYGVTYEYVKTEPKTEDLEAVGQMVQERKLRPVIGRTEKLRDLDAVKDACMSIFNGKGGMGKFVMIMDEETEQ